MTSASSRPDACPVTLDATDPIKPVGLEASGGSTPLRLRVAGEPDSYIFAKLYAKSHVRADRWSSSAG